MMANSPDRIHARDRWLGAALFLAALAYFGLLAPYGVELADEGHLLHQIYRTYLGQTPYVDFHTGYSPGAYYLNAWLLQAFDANLLAVRAALALVNAVCVLAVWWFTRRLGAASLAALLAGVAYLTLIPFFDGQFAPFNIPYPAWYVTLFWLAAVYALVRWWERERWWWMVLAGIAAGLVFSFKQNGGLLALATCLIATVLLQHPGPAATGAQRALRRLEVFERWSIPAVLSAGFFLLFGGFAPGSQAMPLVTPLLALLTGVVVLGHSSPARDVPPGRLTLDLALLSLGFLSVTVPWLLYFWERMGTTALLRDIFYIGTAYEQHYLIPYPSFGRWGVALAASAAAMMALPPLARRAGLGLRPLITAVALAGIGGAALLLLRPPPMVEGLQASVVMRARDLSFAIVLILLWAGGAAYFSRLARRSPRAGIHLILALSAILMHMQIYPRSDFMHLVYAAPGTLILGAWLLDGWANRLATAVGVAPRHLPLANALTQAPAWILIAVFLAPALGRIDYLLRAWTSGDPAALVRLDSRTAPLVIEPAAGRMFESLSGTVRFLRGHTQADDHIFTFPCLDLLTFLAERQDATRHGYYYPGSPGHAVEAEVVDALQDTPPRYAVTLHDHALFFVGAPVYYFNLRRHVTAEYEFATRFGQIDVLAPRGSAALADAPAPANGDGELAQVVELWRAELRHDRGGSAAALAAALAAAPPRSPAELAALLAASPEPQQRLLAELIKKSRSAAGAAALAIALADPGLPERQFQLFSRIVSSIADLRAASPLLLALDQATPARRPWIAGNLFTITSKSWIEDYFYAPDGERLPAGLAAQLPPGRLIQWLQDPWENPAIRSFALRMAGRLRDPLLVPFLLRLAGDAGEMPELRMDATHSLVEMGYDAWAVPVLAAMMPGDAMVTGALVREIHESDPDAARDLIEAGIASPNATVRAHAYWIAAGVRDPRLAPLLERGLADPSLEIRMAAAWGLGRLGGSAAIAALDGTGPDEHPEVLAFIERARRRARPEAPPPS